MGQGKHFYSTHLLFLISVTVPFILSGVRSSAQHYFIFGRYGITETLWSLDLNHQDCSFSETSFVLNNIGVSGAFNDGSTMSPDSNIFNHGGNAIYQIDSLTGQWSLYFSFPNITNGLVSVGNDIFYGIETPPSGNLYEINVANGTLTNLGSTGFQLKSDLTLFNGEIYYVTEIGTPPNVKGIVRVDINNPSNSTLVVTIPMSLGILGLSASNICNTLLAIDLFNHQIIAINLIEGTITPIYLYDSPPFNFIWIVSMQEFIPPTCCEIMIDLDMDDSSGATDADYNSQAFTCLSSPVKIADTDISILFDALLSVMTIQLTGFLPDSPNEFLIMTGSVPGINVSGSGTDLITLSNAGGAKSDDFKNALRFIRYNNTSIYPTGGLRTVEVQFTTQSGAMSNIATDSIQVNELPLIPLDLGPDLEKCEGETVTFDAGNPGAVFYWATGQTTQSITVGSSGQYIVSVSNGFNCPNQDTVQLDILPLIHVALSGDPEICFAEPANMTIHTDSPFPLTLEITPVPGSPFILINVTDNYPFFDLPVFTTTYTITNVTPSQPACVEITNSSQEVYVFPTYTSNVDVSICSGDSIWLGYYWEDQAGFYDIYYHTVDGCDSIVNFTISVLPAINISLQATTCDPSGVGVFITHLANQNGCDTVVHMTVSLLPSDSTLISLTSCNSANTGVFTQTLTNQQGCDSLIITNIAFTISHSSDVHMTSCDSAALGVFMDTLTAADGCDSLVTTTVTAAPADTNYLSATSCDSSALGVFQSVFSNQSGCDSLVISTIAFAIGDSVYVNSSSCDSSSLGVFEMHFNSQLGCDSTVFTTVTYAISDYTNITTTSCDSGQIGIFVDTLKNKFGCDSIVTKTVGLLPSDQTFINSNTCDPASSGVFMQTLVNQYGCDSIVTETVDLLPSDQTFLSSTTCTSSQSGVFVTDLFNQYGCDSIVTLTVILILADTTILSFKTCYPNQVGSAPHTFTNIDGCDSLVIEQTDLYPLPDLNVEVSSDFNGYDISCFGESDGSAIANVTGVSPYSYIWSTGDTDQSIIGLSAGLYTVTVTDGDGCKSNGEISLVDPEPFSISFLVSQPDCFDQHAGNITVNQAGGVLPIRYSIDGVNYQASPSFNGLTDGTYQVTALDANDCETKEIIWINVPLAVNVDLGDDRIIEPGDTAIIQAIVNVPYDSLKSISWSGLINPNCPTCLTQPVVPIITSTYSVLVSSADGCSDADSMTLFLNKNIDVFVPNIFSPNGDNINDRLVIGAGSDIQEISTFVIYDRWGNNVFSADHFQSNDLNNSWDGTLKGKRLNSSVFAYKMIVQFKDGRNQVRYGDITLLK